MRLARKMTQSDFREIAREMVNDARASLADLPNGLPDSPFTDGQYRLAARSGTPKTFARNIIQLVGEISPIEARTAVARYLEEWNAA